MSDMRSTEGSSPSNDVSDVDRSELLLAMGARLRELRAQSGLHQSGLAVRSGLHQSYISGVERGERNLSVENVAKIAAALEVPIAALFELAPSVAKDIEMSSASSRSLLRLFSVTSAVSAAAAFTLFPGVGPILAGALGLSAARSLGALDTSTLRHLADKARPVSPDVDE